MLKLIESIEFKPYEVDLKINARRILANEAGILSEKQTYGLVLACLASKGESQAAKTVFDETVEKFGEVFAHGVLGAATLMSMTNIYYSAKMNLKSLAVANPNLKMSFMAKHGIDETDFELFTLAVSAINHCKPCMVGHEKALVDKHDVAPEIVNEAVRVAAVINMLTSRTNF